MRILHFDSDALEAPLGGGQARRTFEINRRLSSRHDITVVTAGYRGVRSTTIDGVRYLRMLAVPPPAHLLEYFIEIIPRGLFTNADVIVEDFSAPFTASGLPAVSRKPVVGVASYMFARQATAKYRLPLAKIASMLISRYRYLEALTPLQRDELAGSAPHAEIRLIGNGADDGAFDHPWRGGDYVAFLGRLDRDMKGLDLLLSIAERLPPNLRVLIAGDGVDRNWLRGAILQRGLDGRVTLVGQLRGEERHRFIADAAVLAFTSRYENQSLVALDALAIGVPTVAFGAPSIAAVFDGCAELAQPFDVVAFAAELTRLASSGPAARALSERARRVGATHRWDRSAKLHESFLEDVTSRPRRPAS